MTRKFSPIIVNVLILILVISCSSTKQVSRIGVNTTTDLSGRWNDTDSRMVAGKMIKDVLGKTWLTDFVAKNGRNPVVIVGTVRNKSNEHINVETFIKDIERELINSGQVKFVAARKQREELREERLEQQSYASEETVKKLANETGADFMLQGTLNSIEDTIKGKKVIYYQTDLELIHLETNEKVWMGTEKIKKFISQKKFKS
ncbi:MAG: penicillin-binding protein activator LpoB [Candidatus Cloacimonadota bacterium]|nr:MAG: penicillin-binding protein activator LpoB [Candidatus Cloacimonadota bacterium]